MLDLPPEAYPLAIEMQDESGGFVAFVKLNDPKLPVPDPCDFPGAQSVRITFAKPVPFS